MILFFQKRVVISLAFTLLCTSATPAKAHDSNVNNPALVAGLIGAGILGVCGIIYGIVQTCKKSNEQILKDAQEAFDRAQMYGQCFYPEYVNTFEQARFGSDLNYVEAYFLEAVVRRAQEPQVHINVEEHIDAVHRSLTLLEKALTEVKGAVESLKSRNKTHQSIYERLVSLMHDIEAKLAYLRAYYQRFADHRAYFVLAAFESKLYARYKDAIALGNQCSTTSYQFEKQLLHIAKMHNVQSEYPLVNYHAQLRDNIATLERYIRGLRYRYINRVTAAEQMFNYLVHIRDVIADTPAFKEEWERKKEDDARREMLALRQREVQAQADMAAAAERQAHAARQQAQAAERQAQAAQQQVYLKQIELAQPRPQATMVVVSNK